MMNDLMGIIYTSKNELMLRELTVSRAVAALPVAGRYRMIDFILSNMVNTGIKNVGVIMQKNYHSLMDHLGPGKEWDLHTKNDGLFILPPFLTRENVGTYGGILDALRSNMGYLRRSKQEYVILANSHTAFSTDFYDMLARHNQTHADMTLMYSRKPMDELDQSTTLVPRHVFLDVDAEGRLTEFEVGPSRPKTDKFYMDVMLLKRTLLVQLIDEAFAQSRHDINRDILQRFVYEGRLRMFGYEYAGYNRRVETINSYYALNIDMIDTATRQALFNGGRVYTKVRDEVPARYLSQASAVNSLVADGCVIDGHVENSVLFRGVKVCKGAVVRDSILMQEDYVGPGAELENVILDKKVTIRDGGRLIAPKGYPMVIGKNITI